MKLISEEITEIELLQEAKDGKPKELYIQGKFLMFNEINQNGRIYPEKVMDTAVARYIKEYVDKRRGMGELNHPPHPHVNPERAAVLTTDLWKEGNFYMGKAKVLTHTPMGKIVEGLLIDGVCLGVSSRGLGSIKAIKEGRKEVQNDYVITAAIDVVADPSVREAFVEGVYESMNYFISNGVLTEEKAGLFEETIKKAKKKDLIEAKLKAWELMINEFAGK